MTWFDYVLIAWLAIGGLGAVLLIGKPRKPIDPAVAMWTVLINALLILGVVALR